MLVRRYYLQTSIATALALAAACHPAARPLVAPVTVMGHASDDSGRPVTEPIADGAVLYVLDGRVLATAADTAMPAEVRALDPSRIASVQVLKGAAAKQRYGARGENGVVVITTRQPTAGEQGS